MAKVFPRALFYDRANASAQVGKLGFDNQLGGTFDLTTWVVLAQFVNAYDALHIARSGLRGNDGICQACIMPSTQIFPGMPIPEWVKVGFDDASKRVMSLNAQLVGAQGRSPAAGRTSSGGRRNEPSNHLLCGGMGRWKGSVRHCPVHYLRHRICRWPRL